MLCYVVLCYVVQHFLQLKSLLLAYPPPPTPRVFSVRKKWVKPDAEGKRGGDSGNPGKKGKISNYELPLTIFPVT